MLRRVLKSVVTVVTVATLTSPAWALAPGTDVVSPAAVRGEGRQESFWYTDLIVHNPGTMTAGVDIYWLDRGQANTNPIKVSYLVGADATLVIEDVVLSDFGFEEAAGALRVISDTPVIVTTRVYAGQGDESYGQGFEAIPLTAATVAGESTRVPGVVHTDDFRTNLIAVDVSGSGTTFEVSVLDASGTEVASKTYTLGIWEPFLRSFDDLGISDLESGTVQISVTAGAGLFAASKVTNTNNDGTTLASTWSDAPRAARAPAGRYFGTVSAGEGSLGGFVLDVDDDDEVMAVAFSYDSDKDGCVGTFRGGGTFDEPIPLSELADGITFVNTYDESGAEMTWFIQLWESDRNVSLTGSLHGEGAVWTGADGDCNGVHPSATVELGKTTLD